MSPLVEDGELRLRAAQEPDPAREPVYRERVGPRQLR